MTTQTQEALTALGANALVQKQIDPVLLDYVRRYSPLIYSLPDRHWDSVAYFYNSRTALGAGGAVQDGGTRPLTTSTYSQNSYTIKNFQQVGGVTGYAQAVTRSLIGDLLVSEEEGAVQGQTWDIETALLWGSAGATAGGQYPTMDGADTLIANYSGVSQNAIDVAEAPFALRHLDLLIDNVQTNAAMAISSSPWAFWCSPTVESKIAQLLTNQQRFTSVEVAPGLVVSSYRNVPIIPSSFLGARSFVVGAVPTATATTGGTLAAATYYYRVSAVIARFGEIAASAEVSQATTGATSTVTLTLPNIVGPDAATPIQYKVYRSTGTGTETLLGITDAFDPTGAPATTIVDTGATLLPNGVALNAPAAYVATNTGQKPRSVNDEDIYLIARDANFVVRPWVRNFEKIPLAATVSSPDMLPFALVTDCCLAIRAPKYAARLSRVQIAL